MHCTKTPYSKREAQEVLNRLSKSGRWNQKQLGIKYECEVCGSWHITHIEEYQFEKSKVVENLKFKKTWKKLLKNKK